MSLDSGEIRRLRPARPPVDPERALGVELELEREPDGRTLPSVTVFLAGAECPFACVFCDLWRYTLDGPTPPGALVRQLEAALDQLPASHRGGRIKLYNASNFFDSRAVPPEDLEPLAELVSPFERVVVECHARLVGESCRRFAERLGGRLELALGLETSHAETLARLEKGMTLEEFDRAARRLAEWGVPWRAFVLVGVPYLGPREGDGRAQASVDHALLQGAERAVLIPVRAGNGALEELRERGQWWPPTLPRVEAVFERAWRAHPGRVTVDLWDLESLASCEHCFEARRRRLARIPSSGDFEPEVSCGECRTG